MEAQAPPDTPTHAELAAQIPAPPPDDANDAILFARSTLKWTSILALGFVGAAVVWTFILQS